MSVTLISPPPAFAFSRDQLKLRFQCTNTMETVGVNSRNGLQFPVLPVPAGNAIIFNYGTKSVTMTSANAPDDSGFQFLSTTSDLNVLLGYFTSNYTLSDDFDISLVLTTIYFTAKKQSLGYDVALNSGPYHTLQCVSVGVIAKEKANYTVLLRLFCENAAHDGYLNIYEHNIPVTYGSWGIAEKDISDILHDYITTEIRNTLPDLPVTGHVLCKKSCRKYYFQFAESYSDPVKVYKLQKSAVFTVLHGGLSSLGEALKSLPAIITPDANRGNDRFLKQGPLEVDTRADQPQYLYFFNARALTTASLNCRYYFTDGSVAVIILETFTLNQFDKVGFNVRFDQIYIPDDYPTKRVNKYELWLTDSTSAVISESRYYVLDNEFRQYFKYFLNWSSWGTMDTRMFYGKGSVEFDLVQSEAEKSAVDPTNISLGTSLVYDIAAQTKFSLTTGFIKDKYLLLFNRDFFLSPLKFLVYSGSLLPIKVTSKTIAEISDGDNLFAQKFDFQYLFDDHSYTEGDIFAAPVVVPVPVGQFYFGAMASRPSTALQVKALSSQSPGVYLFPLATGLNRFFIVALPPGKTISNVYNQVSDENLTSEFISSIMAIDSLNYRLYVMEMAINFSINNTLIISIINA